MPKSGEYPVPPKSDSVASGYAASRLDERAKIVEYLREHAGRLEDHAATGVAESIKIAMLHKHSTLCLMANTIEKRAQPRLLA